MGIGNSIDYVNQNKNGWYLLVINKETMKEANNFNYKKIKNIKMESITTTALNHLKKDGLFYNTNLATLLRYEISLLRYSNTKVSSRYVMKFKKEISAIDGYYDGWEYSVKNKKGDFSAFDKNYNAWRAYKFPLIISFLQILFIISTYFFSEDIASFIQSSIYKDNDKENTAKYYSLTNEIFAFGMFYVALIYSTLTILVKDLIKPHFIKDDLKRIRNSIFVFEIPVYIAAIYASITISQFEEGFIWDLFIILIIISLFSVSLIVCFTYFLEKEKRYK